MSNDVQPSSSSRSVRKFAKKASKAIMKSHRVALPFNYDSPIRLRPWFLLFTCIIVILLAFLGLTNIAHSLPLNDKFLHLTCFCVATAVFYFIFDVEEEARRIWFWRHANLIFTAVVCFFGGLIGEVVQSMLPYMHFDMGDVIANVVGSGVGLYGAYHIEKHYRSRREIAQLYRPLDTDEVGGVGDESDGETEPSGTLLPLFNSRSGDSSAKSTLPSKTKIPRIDRFSNVWDEREELFGIGDDSDSEETPTPRLPGRPDGPPQAGPVPTITIAQF